VGKAPLPLLLEPPAVAEVPPTQPLVKRMEAAPVAKALLPFMA